MSRRLDHANAWPSSSRHPSHILQLVGAVSRYAHNNGHNQQSLHNNTAEPQTGYHKHLLQKETAFANGTFLNNNGDSKSPIPLPDWSVALTTWGISWNFHVYGFSALFMMLTVVSMAIFLRFRPRVQRFKIVYNTLILLATSGIFRAVFLLVDPYGYKGRMARLMVGVMMQAVYPLLCACYGLTQVMLLRLTNVDVGRSRLRTLSCLLGCTLTYLFMVVVIETLVSYQRSLKLLLLLDSGCFIVWSTSLGATFICSGFRLTQYAMETKKAHKQLNTFSNQRRSASNTTGLSAITSITNDADASLLNVDILSTVSDALMLPITASATADSFSASSATSCSLQTFAAGDTLLPAAAPRPTAQVRLSRPRLKISDQAHMTITIATDDEDVSTSSTDVDRPVHEKNTRRIRRVRKCAKQKRGICSKGPGRSKSQTSSSVYRAVSVGEDNSSPKTSFSCPQGGNQSSDSDNEPFKTTLGNRTSHSNYGSPRGSSINQHESAATFTCEQQEIVSKETSATFSQISLLGSSALTTQELRYGPKSDTNELSKYANGSKINEVYKEILSPVKYSTLSSVSINDDSLPPTSTTFDAHINNLHTDNSIGECTETPMFSNNNSCDKNTEPLLVCIPIEQSSWRENGYLADTENLFSCSTFSRLSNSFRRKRKSHDQFSPAACDVSPQRTSSSQSDDSTASPVLQGRIKPTTSASLGLFRIRQSTVVQRAVHLTYFLTFLFMFASLLQLYTVFGVYGVLGTNPRPDPWPWLILHTIFRATEVSIGFSIAAIAYITLNYRNQRAKRRHQQQQHLVATRDCIV